MISMRDAFGPPPSKCEIDGDFAALLSLDGSLHVLVELAPSTPDTKPGSDHISQEHEGAAILLHVSCFGVGWRQAERSPQTHKRFVVENE